MLAADIRHGRAPFPVGEHDVVGVHRSRNQWEHFMLAAFHGVTVFLAGTAYRNLAALANTNLRPVSVFTTS